MHRSLFALKLLTLASAVSAIAVTASHAVEAEDVAARLQHLLSQQHQFELTYSSVSQSGTDVIFADAAIKSAEATAPLELGNLVLQNVTDADNKAYHVERIGLDQVTHKDEEMVVDMKGFELKGLILPSDTASDNFAGMLRYDSLDVDSVEVDAGDQDLLWVENISSTSSIAADNSVESNFNIESFSLNLYAIDDPEDDEEFGDRLRELNYDEIHGSIEIAGTWQPSDGRVTLSKFATSMDDIGNLNLTLDLGGYTAAFAKSVAEMTASMQAGSEDDGAQGMAFLGLLQQLSFHGSSIRFDDDSFTGRMLNHLADRQGVEPEQLIDQTKTSIQTQLSALVGNDFATSAAQAVADFLDNPSNLEIVAKPAAPVPFFMLGAAVMGAPQTLITQLGLKVTANQ